MPRWITLELVDARYKAKRLFKKVSNEVLEAIKTSPDLKRKTLFKHGEVKDDYAKIVVDDFILYMLKTGHILLYKEDVDDRHMCAYVKNEITKIPLLNMTLKYKVMDIGDTLEEFYNSDIFKEESPT